MDAETNRLLLDLKAKTSQAVLMQAIELDNIKKQQHEMTVQREREVLRHTQKLAETERAQNELLEKMEADLVFQNKAEVANRLLKSRQKKLDWLQQKEREDYEEQQRRDTEDYEDQRQLKRLRAKRQMEREDTGILFEQQQTLQRQSFERDLHRTVVFDSLRKGKHNEEASRSIINTIFNKQEEKHSNVDGDATNESEGEESSLEKAKSYKPYNPFHGST